MIGRVDDSTAASLAMQEIMQSSCIAYFRHHHHEELCGPDPCCSQGRLFLLRLLPNCLLHHNCLGENANPSAESRPTPCIIYRINTQKGEIVRSWSVWTTIREEFKNFRAPVDAKKLQASSPRASHSAGRASPRLKELVQHRGPGYSQGIRSPSNIDRFFQKAIKQAYNQVFEPVNGILRR